MATNGSTIFIVSVEETLNSPGLREGSIIHVLRPRYDWSDGTGAGQNNRVWSSRITLAAGATHTINLASGLTDTFGNAISFDRVTLIGLFNRETAVGTRVLSFGPAAAQPYPFLFADTSDRVLVRPGGAYLQWTDEGISVTAGSADSLSVVNTDGANPVDFDIVIVGRQ